MIVVDSRKRKEMLMMKNKLMKVLALAVCGGVFLTSANTANAGTNNVSGDGGTTVNTGDGTYDGTTTDANGLADTQIDVQAQVIGGSEIVYSVKIDWGNMKFVYDYGSAWNPSTHSYTGTSGGTGAQGGGWVPSYVDGTNNVITITNNSNFPLDADLAYTPGTASLNANAGATGSVVGIFADANATFTTPILNEGAGGANTQNMATSSAVLEMNHENITDAGTFYYYKTSSSGSNVASKFFALSGTPDPGLNTTFSSMTTVGQINVSLAPVTGATKVTN